MLLFIIIIIVRPRVHELRVIKPLMCEAELNLGGIDKKE